MRPYRVVAILLATSALIAGAACGDDDDEPTDTEAAVETDAPAETEAPVTEPEPEPEDETEVTDPPMTDPPVTDPPETDPPETTDASPADVDDAEDDGMTSDIERATALVAEMAMPVEVEPLPAYEGGSPVDTGGGMIPLRYYAGTVPTADFDPSVDGLASTYTVHSEFDTAYSANVPSLLLLGFEIDKLPTDCLNICGVSTFGSSADGFSIAAGADVPIPIVGSTTFFETSWRGTESIDVFGQGNAEGGFDIFTNPAFVVTNQSQAGTFILYGAPLIVDNPGVYFFNVETDNPLEASARTIVDLPVSGVDLSTADLAVIEAAMIGP